MRRQPTHHILLILSFVLAIVTLPMTGRAIQPRGGGCGHVQASAEFSANGPVGCPVARDESEWQTPDFESPCDRLTHPFGLGESSFAWRGERDPRDASLQTLHVRLNL